MLIAHDHEVWGDDALVGLLEARVGERAGNELARGWVVCGRGLMRVQWAAVVSWWAELVSGICEYGDRLRCERSYLLGGSWYLRLFARPTGSYRDGSTGVLPDSREGFSSSSSTACDDGFVDRSRRVWVHWEHIDDR